MIGIHTPFRAAGHNAVYWSALDAANASDETLMVHGRDRSLTVLTHDLDFGAMLAVTHATGPSVVVIVDKKCARVRVLPMN
jgi:predicted nuclease of predicted toxin-antitoxin system